MGADASCTVKLGVNTPAHRAGVRTPQDTQSVALESAEKRTTRTIVAVLRVREAPAKRGYPANLAVKCAAAVFAVGSRCCAPRRG